MRPNRTIWNFAVEMLEYTQDERKIDRNIKFRDLVIFKNFMIFLIKS